MQRVLLPGRQVAGPTGASSALLDLANDESIDLMAVSVDETSPPSGPDRCTVSATPNAPLGRPSERQSSSLTKMGPGDADTSIGAHRSRDRRGLAADDHDLYLPRSAFAELESLVAFVPDPLGLVRLRVVGDDAWGSISGGGMAPRGAVALDLVDSADPRHWIAAEELVANA